MTLSSEVNIKDDLVISIINSLIPAVDTLLLTAVIRNRGQSWPVGNDGNLLFCLWQASSCHSSTEITAAIPQKDEQTFSGVTCQKGTTTGEDRG